MPLTDIENSGISDFLGFEKSSFRGYVLEGKNSKKAKNKRICVVGQFKLFLFNRGKDVRKQPQQFHFYDILEIDCASQYLNITVKEKGKPVPFTLASENSSEILDSIRNSYELISIQFPANYLMKLNPPISNDGSGASGGGFLTIYEAQCAYYNSLVHMEFYQHVSSLISQGNVILDLSNCPGIEPKSETTLDLVPVFASLRFNFYFRGIVLKHVERKEAIALLSDTMKHNAFLTLICMSNVDADEKSIIALGQSLKENQQHIVQILDLSRNSIGTKGAIALADAIRHWNHALKTLDLGFSSISAKGVVALIRSFEDAYGVSLTIENLNLSGSNLSTHSALAVEDWLNNVKTYSRLQHLTMSSSNCSFTSFPSIKFLQNLTTIDFSRNKIDATESRIIAFLCESSAHLKKINLASCSMHSTSLEPIIEAIVGNVKLCDIDLNISNNNLGEKGAIFLMGIFSRSTHFSSLDISNVKMKEKNFPEFIDSLAKNLNLARLNIKNIFSKNGSSRDKTTQLFVDAFNRLLQSRSLVELNISSGYGHYIILPLLKSMKINTSIQVLDISSNSLGDRGAFMISDIFRSNKTLKCLRFDDNRISLNGFHALHQAMAFNSSIWFPFPRIDSDKVFSSLSDEKYLLFFQEVTNIFQLLSKIPPSSFGDEVTQIYDAPSNVDPLAKVPEYLATLKSTLTWDNVSELTASRMQLENSGNENAPPVPSIEDSLPSQTSSNAKSNRSIPPTPPQLANEWEKCTTDDGDDYWYNAITGESRWTNPYEKPNNPPNYDESLDSFNKGTTHSPPPPPVLSTSAPFVPSTPIPPVVPIPPPAPVVPAPPPAPVAPAPPPVSVAPPPPPAPPIPSAPAPPPVSSSSPQRSALLSSIEGFNPSKLKKVQTNDRSSPLVGGSNSSSSSSSSSSGGTKPGMNPQGGLMGDLMNNLSKRKK